ncbi:hypothetical protein [Cloacibacillus evryensis]|uniref:hypothetical protein n=1 Tax=Cloacibacillus evryensis TaxID=508460 RepID=UPI0012EBBD13|nr:hypothetical protein [Cloacibacillus evryensis]
MNSDDAFEKICPIFLAAITIAKMCDTKNIRIKDSIRDEDLNFKQGIFSLIQLETDKNGDRVVSHDPTCQAGCCAMWQWDDEKNREGHCGLTHGRNK